MTILEKNRAARNNSPSFLVQPASPAKSPAKTRKTVFLSSMNNDRPIQGFDTKGQKAVGLDLDEQKMIIANNSKIILYEKESKKLGQAKVQCADNPEKTHYILYPYSHFLFYIHIHI